MKLAELLFPFKKGAARVSKEAQDEPSVVLISMYKGGSTFLQQSLKTMLLSRGFALVDFAGDAFRAGMDEAQYCIENSAKFVEKGKFFGAFRGAYVRHFADMSDNKIVIHVRDPRDCVVSLYYSWAYSHGAPGGDKEQEFLELREQTRLKDINEFVLERGKDFAEILDAIQVVKDRYPSAFLSHYEEMVTDFETWLGKLQSFLDLDLPDGVLNKVRASAHTGVREENVSRHVRQVTPGDHKRKLRADVQERLTELLRPQLEQFGYLHG